MYSRGCNVTWAGEGCSERDYSALYTAELYCQASSSWITIAPNLIINTLTLSHTQKKPISCNSLTKNEDSLCNKCLYCILNEGLRIFKLLECYMWFFTMWRTENENKIPYLEKKKTKQDGKEPPARKAFKSALLFARVGLFSMACFLALWPTRWAFHSFPLKINIVVQQILLF